MKAAVSPLINFPIKQIGVVYYLGYQLINSVIFIQTARLHLLFHKCIFKGYVSVCHLLIVINLKMPLWALESSCL